MFAILGVIAGAIALILLIIAGHAHLATEFTVAAIIFIAAHLAFAWTPWVRRNP
jgi:hypothetical protein